MPPSGDASPPPAISVPATIAVLHSPPPPPPPPPPRATAPPPPRIIATSAMSCVGLGELACPAHDQLPKDRGCQVKCDSGKPGSKPCPRARSICAKVRGCMRVNLNSDASWATLKGLVANRQGSDPRPVADVDLPWCAPEVRPPDKGGIGCKRSDPLCLVFGLSISEPDPFSARPVSSMPPNVPVLAAHLRDYPKRRHNAITHLTYLVDSYDTLPSTVGLLIDHGDRHAHNGNSDVCAQAIHVADLSRAIAGGALKGERLYKSLSPHPTPVTEHRRRNGGGGGSGGDAAVDPLSPMAQPLHNNRSSRSSEDIGGVGRYRGFKCVRHLLKHNERKAWAVLLEAYLGPPPRAVMSYTGRGELLATREALQSRPRSFYSKLLNELLSRNSPHADALNTLMPRIWGALLGGAFSRQDGFVCDHELGWGQLRGQVAAGGNGGGNEKMVIATTPARLPTLRRPSLSPHDAKGLAASLLESPTRPNNREAATGCKPTSLLCVIVAAHKEDLSWLKRINHPTLVYKRHVTLTGPYLTPNVFHEHAVYLRYICAFYDQLPKLSVFLHGHRSSWHNRQSPAADQLLRTDLQSAASAKGGVYRSFNDYSQCWRDHDGEWATEMLAQLHGWTREIGPLLGPPPQLKESYCCTQFLVSADRIRSRPHSFWRKLLADLLDQKVPQVCKVSGHVLELTWGYLLGEPPNATCRKDGWGASGIRT